MWTAVSVSFPNAAAAGEVGRSRGVTRLRRTEGRGTPARRGSAGREGGTGAGVAPGPRGGNEPPPLPGQAKLSQSLITVAAR